jgi:hypothetical protein
VAHVAARFPELCEAETRMFAELLGTHVQRLATIARGDAACTTHVPLGAPERGDNSRAQRAVDNSRAQRAGDNSRAQRAGDEPRAERLTATTTTIPNGRQRV